MEKSFKNILFFLIIYFLLFQKKSNENFSFWNSIGNFFKKQIIDPIKKISTGCKKGPKDCARSFCYDAVIPSLKKKISAKVCGTLCSKGTSKIITLGGGPEDPVADGLGATFGVECGIVCKKTIREGLKECKKKNKDCSKFVGRKLCSAIFK